MRELVRETVVTRVPLNGAESDAIAAFLDHFDRLERPFAEDADPFHVTGSAIVTGPRGVLLLKHKRLGIWLQPGGHIEEGETPWDAALREASEETGLNVRFGDPNAAGIPYLAHVDVHKAAKGHTHLDLRYMLHAGDQDPNPPPGESQEIAWLSKGEAVQRAADDRLGALIATLDI